MRGVCAQVCSKEINMQSNPSEFCIPQHKTQIRTQKHNKFTDIMGGYCIIDVPHGGSNASNNSYVFDEEIVATSNDNKKLWRTASGTVVLSDFTPCWCDKFCVSLLVYRCVMLMHIGNHKGNI